MNFPLVCPDCGSALEHGAEVLTCARGHDYRVVRGIPRFVEQDTHDNFAIQWNLFWDVQLDSRNGTTESRDRLVSQSDLTPEDFRGKTILEVGCGAGRFTEVMLGLGANVVAIDYSGAIDACAATNGAAITDGRLVVAQGDVFALPVVPRSFDIVVGYGMLQHTGDPRRALGCLWERVRPGGLLLVDRYRLDIRHFLPFKYLARPITRQLRPSTVLAIVRAMCRVLVPLERAALKRAQGKGPLRFVRYILGRFPNSTFPLNLEAQGRLAGDLAWRWTVLDTFDQYAPKYDLPCTAAVWRAELLALPEGKVVSSGSGGQGNTGVVQRRSLDPVEK